MTNTNSESWDKNALWIILGVLSVCLLSPLAPTSRDVPAADSSVFLLIGQGILDGKIPYVDFFDHKGPLLYLINAIGIVFGKFMGFPCGWNSENEWWFWVGVWGLEVFSLCIALFYAYKTARFFAERFSALLAVFVNCVFLGAFFYQGNLPEEYALPLVYISLYLYLRHFIAGRELQRKEILILGSFAGISLLLKPNMFALWAAFSAVYCAQTILERDWRRLFGYIRDFWIGVAIVVIPVLGVLAAVGALPAFYEQYVVFNLRYASASGSILNSLHNFFSIANRLHIWVLPVVAFYLVVRYYGKRECPGFLAWLLSIPLAMLLFANSPHLGERNFMVMVPYYLPAIAFLAGKMDEHFSALNFKVLRFALPCIIFASALYPVLRQNCIEFINSTKRGVERPNPLSLEKANKIKEISKAIFGENKIAGTSAVIGNNSGLYNCTKLPPFSKYLYQYPPIKVAPEILAEFQDQFAKKRPQIVFVVWPYVTAIPSARGDFAKLKKDYPALAEILFDETKYRNIHTENGMAEVFVRTEIATQAICTSCVLKPTGK